MKNVEHEFLTIGGVQLELGLAEAKSRLSELVAAAERGERVVITKHGIPAVEIVPFPKSGGIDFDKLNAARRRLGIEASTKAWPADFDDPTLSRQVLGLE